MSNQHVEVRSVVWKEIFPWLILPRVFAVAISPAVLLCAVLALVGSAAGWRAASMFVVEEKAEAEEGAGPAEELVLYEDIDRTTAGDVHFLGDWPVEGPELPPGLSEIPGVPEAAGLSGPLNPFFNVTSRYGFPLLHLFTPPGDPEDEYSSSRTWKEFGFYLTGTLWTLFVWAFFGGAITRIAALRLARDERLGFLRAVRYSARNILQYFSAPLMPLLGVLLVAILPFLAGLLMRVPVLDAIGGLLWFIALVFGLIITLLLIGMAFGWPLMWPAISSEGRNGDAFDAFSRAYNYTFARPLHYLFYVVIAALIGVLSWMVVGFVAEGVVNMSYWAVSLGSGGARVELLREAADGGELDSSLLEFAGSAVGFWVGVVGAIAHGFGYGYFWCAMTAIYLLLRRDVDQAELEAVEGSDELPTSPLPDLEQRPDPRGG